MLRQRHVVQRCRVVRRRLHRVFRGLSACLHTIYNELSAGRPVIVHLKNTTVSGVNKHANRTSTYEYHLSGSGWTR